MEITGNNGKDNKVLLHNIKVLMYHKIVKDEECCRHHWTYVSEKQFRKHLSLLDKWGFTPITFKDYLLFANGKLTLPKKPVIITFDDGYEVVYDIAFPIVKDMGWNAVVFVIGDDSIKTNTWDSKVIPGDNALLNAEQIIEMHESGFEIGSHSMSHLFLPNEPFLKACYEVIRSKEKLEMLLGSGVSSFCYPFGAVNKQLKNLVKDAGYKIGCGVYTGPPKFGSDYFDVRRITISNITNSIRFALKMLTPFEYYEYISSKAFHKYNRQNNGTVIPDEEIQRQKQINKEETFTNV